MADLFPLAAPLLHRLDPETAHRLTIWGLRLGAGPTRSNQFNLLSQRLFGLDFPNPVGQAAGADKNAEVPEAMLRLGFGFVEVGTVTPKPQAGNPKPRVFRLHRDGGLINRLGFNNAGLEAAVERLGRLGPRAGPVGVNIGANRDAADPIADYVTGIRGVAAVADYVTVNISSPNTPGLRKLQGPGHLEDLLARVLAARDGLAGSAKPLPVLVKLAPDLDDGELAAIAEVLGDSGINGAIMGNTTVGLRERLQGRHAGEAGGLSGRPLFDLSTERLAALYRLLGGTMPLIGVGGIDSGARAYAKIKAGASLVQLYTGLVHQGAGLIGEICTDLEKRLRADGFRTISEAVGRDAERPSPLR